ncbi:terminase small subunit [Roseateles toxinivorans]|uniref:Terminase small subunit n=1 Tax=Roseateles toxinivorans TaxID=270368 RepID=A0A4R6QIH6_9BURK|nr:terminase small subunit [Roseateles toxinivorans]TDP63154.1 terminase small subunit [Roseateles toxinivorans]
MNGTTLTPKAEAFARLVVEGSSLAAAFRKIYPRSQSWQPAAVHVNASKLLANAKVALRVRELQEAAAERSTMKAAGVLNELRALVHSDIADIMTLDGKVKLPHELAAGTRAAVKTFKIDEYGRIEYQFWDKNAAIEKAMKHLGLYEKDNKQKTDALGDLLNSLSGKVVSPVS